MCLVPQFTVLLLSARGPKPLVSSFTVLCSWEEVKKFINCVLYSTYRVGSSSFRAWCHKRFQFGASIFTRLVFTLKVTLCLPALQWLVPLIRSQRGDKQHLQKMFCLCPDHCKSENSFSLTYIRNYNSTFFRSGHVPFASPTPPPAVCTLVLSFHSFSGWYSFDVVMELTSSQTEN